jgi:hypothetical protein
MPLAGAHLTEFTALYEECCACKQQAQMVTITDRMLHILAEVNDSWVQDCHPSQMGIDPANRSGKKMKKNDSHRKGATICKVGFSPKLCGPDRAVAMQVSPLNSLIADHTTAIQSAPGFGKTEGAFLLGGSLSTSYCYYYDLEVVLRFCFQDSFCY